jgi:hypothetical protein
MKVTKPIPAPAPGPAIVAAEVRITVVEKLLAEVHDLLDVSDDDFQADDLTPVYQWAQQINSQVSKAQGGQGPYRLRYLKIAELALRAILAIDRSQS